MSPHPSHKRVCHRYAARPIRLPTREIKALAKKLAQRLHQYGLPKPGRVIAQEDLYVTNVMGDEVVVEILLTGTPGRDRDPFSKNKKLLNGGFLKRRPEGPVMRVFVNPHFDRKVFEEWYARKIVEDELYRLLAHEMTHAADVWSGKGSVGDLTKSKDDLKRHHHNHPAEVRALMRDVVTHLDDGDLVRELMGYGMNFNTAFREALKETKWVDIEPYLNPKNQKTILKGVYTHMQDQGLTKAASRTAGGFQRVIEEIEDETGLEAKVEAQADSIKIELKRGTKMVGYFRASTVNPDSFQWKGAPLDCKEAWGQIGEPPVWIIRGAELFDPDLRGKGFGKLLYKALFSYIASKKGVVGPNRCSGGSTSPDAQRVWKSLRSMYPKHGPLIDLRKMASASRVATRFRRREAGLLQAPPKLVEAVTKWAQATFAGRAYALATNTRKSTLGAPDDSFEHRKLEVADQQLKTLKPRKRIDSGKTRGDVSTTFDFTEHLGGWRYKQLWDDLTPEQQRDLRKGPLRPFIVKQTFQSAGSAKAGWSHRLHELHYWLEVDAWDDPKSLTDKLDRKLPKDTRHELQHVTQNAIAAMAGLASVWAGLPKKKLRQDTPPEEQAQRQTQNVLDYFKSDIEYQTAISDAVDDWEHKTLPPVQAWLDQTDLSDRHRKAVLRHVVRVFVAETRPKFPSLPRDFKRPTLPAPNPKAHQFFDAIKRHPSVEGFDRWTNAVATFYKEIARTTKLANRRLARRYLYAKQPFDLAMNGLKGLDEGRTVTLYHGTTKSFDRFDLDQSRDELVNDFYGKGIFLTPSKKVAWEYANANRNMGLDPSIIGELKRKNKHAGAFLESLYRLGFEGAWETVLPESIYEEETPEGSDPPAAIAYREFEDSLKGIDPNTLNDIAGYIEGSKVKPLGGGSTNIFSTSSGAPEWLYDDLDEVGLNSSVYRPKVYTVGVTVQNPLITASASEAKKARANGYDSVVFHGSRLVDGVPEVAVFSPRNAKIQKVEVE